MEKKPFLFVMVGIPGSGKSTYAQFIKGNLHSSDSIRKELWGDENDQQNPAKVFETLHNRIKEDLLNGNNTIYDATNLSAKGRKCYLESLSDICCCKVCIFVNTSLDICIKQNNSRMRKVPEDVIIHMHEKIDAPTKDEGWDIVVEL